MLRERTAGAWFTCLLRRGVRKQSESILTIPEPARGGWCRTFSGAWETFWPNALSDTPPMTRRVDSRTQTWVCSVTVQHHTPRPRLLLKTPNDWSLPNFNLSLSLYRACKESQPNVFFFKLNWSQNKFPSNLADRYSNEYRTVCSWNCPPHLTCVHTLPCNFTRAKTVTK